MKKSIIFSTIITFIFSCSSPKTENISSYYFPFDKLKNGKKYVYEVNTNNDVSTFSIRLKSKIANGKKYLYTKNYINNNIVSDGVELISTNNSILLSGRFYEPSKNNSFVAMESLIDKKENVVFPFIISGKNKYSLRVSNRSKLNNNVIEYSRSREFDGFSQISFNGKMVKCIIISSKERFLHHNTKTEFIIKEYFGRNIGLIKTEKKGLGISMTTTLKQIEPYD